MAFVVVAGIIVLAFYWYEWLPTQAAKECAETAYYTGGVGTQEKADEIYQNCMRGRGFNQD